MLRPAPAVDHRGGVAARSRLMARSAGDPLGGMLAGAVRERAAEQLVQRVHFTKLKAVDSHYTGETATAGAFLGAPEARIAACARVYAGIQGRGTSDPVTFTTTYYGSHTDWDLRGLGGPFVRATPMAPTASTTLTVGEWRTALATWRKLLNERLFARPPGAPGTYPGQLPFNFALTPAHQAWITSTYTNQGVGRDSALEQAASEVTVAGGRLVRAAGGGGLAAPVDTSASITWFKGIGWEIYVLSHDGHLHMASHFVGRRHHSSLLGLSAGSATGAKDAAGAGEMQVRAGKIEQLSVKTGHYSAGMQQLGQVVHLLSKRGANLVGTRLLNYDDSVIAPDARVWWDTIGQAAYESDKAHHAVIDFDSRFGPAAVDFELTSLGWTVVPTGPGQRFWTVPGGNVATPKQIRKALKAGLGVSPRPSTTEGVGAGTLVATHLA